MPTSKVQQVACVGALIFIAGIFLPIVSIPVIGDVSYYRMDNMSAILTILFAALAPVFIMMNKSKLTALAALGVWLVLLWPIIKNLGGGSDNGVGGILGDIVDSASDPLAKMAGEIFSNIDLSSAGGLVFLIGLLLLTYGSIMTSLKAR